MLLSLKTKIGVNNQEVVQEVPNVLETVTNATIQTLEILVAA
jgi:hypothetical protein